MESELILVFIILSIILTSGCVEDTESYIRKNVTKLKFVSSENCLYSLSDAEIRELKELGVNGIRICPHYGLHGGKVVEELSPKYIVGLIRKAHNAGFVVFLEINAGGKPNEEGVPEYMYGSEEELNELYSAAEDWARIAEEEGVEFYSPLNEPNVMFTDSELIELWINRTIDLHRIFSGNLVAKFADVGPEEMPNLTGYDYLAFDIMWSDSDYERLGEYLDLAVEKGLRLKEKYGLKGFFFGELGVERRFASKDVQAEVFRTVLSRTWGKVNGYCFLGWSNLEFGFKDNNKAKEVIREWYGKPINNTSA